MPAEDEEEAFKQIRRFLSFLPPSIDELPPCIEPPPFGAGLARWGEPEETLQSIVPANRRAGYDMRQIMRLVVDGAVDDGDGGGCTLAAPGACGDDAGSSFFEIGMSAWGCGMVTGLARLGGRPVGVMGNDCNVLAGAMTAEAAQKTRRFIGLCSTFHLPIVSFVDEPVRSRGAQRSRPHEQLRRCTDRRLSHASPRACPPVRAFGRRSMRVAA